MEEKARVSRTKKKKAATAAQHLGERLVTLDPARLATLQLPAELIDALQAARAMRSHGARRRQMQYIGTLMRQCDSAAIETALAEIAQQDHAEVLRFKQIEGWRDELVAGDDDRLNWLLTNFPAAEKGLLTRLVLAARGISGKGVDPLAGRKLFRYLKAISAMDA